MTNGGEGNSGYVYSEEKLKKLRKNFEEIKKEFEKRKYKLLTNKDDYKNCYTKLKCICPRGHKYSTIWNSFQQGQGCSYCTKQKIDFINIKKEFESRGYKLLTKEEEYKNNKQKLEYIHNKCGKEHSISWNHFKENHGCYICSRKLISKKLRKNFEDIKNEFEKREYKLLTKEEQYKNCYTKLKYICNNGHNHSITWRSFQQGQNCLYCSLKET